MKKFIPEINADWKKVLDKEFKKPYFKALQKALQKEYTKETVYPAVEFIFNAFEKTPFDTVKVILLGQDPYHGPGQAHGLCFSVPHGIKPPHSLINIFKELSNDLDIPVPLHGNLGSWATQGVLLLNTTLTVRAKSPLSHHGIGWEIFTDQVIQILSGQKKGLVFLLWGKNAQTKEILIDTSKHFVLKAAHPSPFSASNGFFGCRHFSKTNEILKKEGLKEIDWNI
jgi:uracil-DNA glycosylase